MSTETAHVRRLFVILLLTAVASIPASRCLARSHGDAASTAILPPPPPWDGASRRLMVSEGDPWITPSEKTGLMATPRYDETVAWLKRLVAEAPELEMVPIGTSPEGRELWMVIASADRAFTPEALAETGKPVLLAQAGIHSGEIDGKDAGLMLLRDLTVGGSKRALLDRAALLFVPIFNVDGHERFSRFGRVNQRGPEEMGWRTTSRNLNLNRDYAKLDTPEMRAMISTINRWQPDLYVDLHVTDGIDYQYDITWGYSGRQAYSPAIATWLDEVLTPAAERHLEAHGHVPGPLVFALDNADPKRGLFDWTASSPRYSDGYGSARHLPTILVENHSLKPYDQRVLGTYLLLESMLETLGKEGGELRRAMASDRARRPETVPLAFTVPGDQPPSKRAFKGIASEVRTSEVTGGEVVVWTGEPVMLELPVLEPTVVAASAKRPVAYWIPPAWSLVIERLAIHGVEMERIDTPRTVEVEMIRLQDPTLDERPLEGHARVRATGVAERRRVTMAAGSVRVGTDQPLGDLAMLLLEPASPDSFFQWGFFLEVLQRTEYMEAYVMVPMAEAMLAEDETLRAAFDKALEEDEALRGDASARLRWFYERTPFYDDRFQLYPVARELAGSGGS